MHQTKKASIILIGCGPHAKRIYLPALKALRDQGRVELALVVDILPKEDSVRAALAEKWGPAPPMLFVEPFGQTMPTSVSEELAAFVALNDVTGVLISTEPLVHRTYAEWALRQGLNILMDKPISARVNSASEMAQAEALMDDYLLLLERYQQLQARKETAFTVNAQRRFHAGYQFVEAKLREVGEKTQCPVTFIQSYHCDGQWRLPNEIVTQKYHPYCLGYGKASHSGYHIFDTMFRFYQAAGVREKLADSMDIVSSFIQPNGFFKQLTAADYFEIFGDAYEQVQAWDDNALREKCRNYGEIDMSSMVTLKKEGEAVANFNVNLVHNGFARRTWTRPGQDLYKGNGRVKHETHNIQQGPFQNIQIHSYQATDRHDVIHGLEDDLGGKNHFDIYVFRNPLVNGGRESLEVFKLSDLIAQETMPCDSMLATEWTKHQVVAEFVDFLNGRKPKAAMRSQIDDHVLPVQLMSGVYRSHILRSNDEPCTVRAPFGLANMYAL